MQRVFVVLVIKVVYFGFSCNMSGANPRRSDTKVVSGIASKQVRSKESSDSSLGLVTEEELMKKSHVTPEDVLRLPKATQGK